MGATPERAWLFASKFLLCEVLFMFRLIKLYLRDERGAVTVDWVVLTAAIVGLTVMIATAMQDEAVAGSDSISSYMTDYTFD